MQATNPTQSAGAENALPPEPRARRLADVYHEAQVEMAVLAQIRALDHDGEGAFTDSVVDCAGFPRVEAEAAVGRLWQAGQVSRPRLGHLRAY